MIGTTITHWKVPSPLVSTITSKPFLGRDLRGIANVFPPGGSRITALAVAASCNFLMPGDS
jgi:hypothetical protein